MSSTRRPGEEGPGGSRPVSTGPVSTGPVSPGPVSVRSVDRAITALDLLAEAGELGVTQLADALEVHKSTAFRLLATLERHALVEQNVERGRYRLGVGIIQLAGATSQRLDVVQESRPIARQLAQSLGETVGMAVMSGREALYVDQVLGSGALQIHNWLGQRVPLHATPDGKALLAWLTAQQIDELLTVPLPPFTENTRTDPGPLRAELELVRRRGYAVAVDELEIGLTAVAAPVRRADGTVSAALSVCGPTFRIPESRVGEVAAAVVDAARRVSCRLGWHGLTAPP